MLITRIMFLFTLALLLKTATISGVLAQSRAAPRQGAEQPAGAVAAGRFDDWNAYTSGKDRAKVCYALSQPKDRRPGGLNRDPAYIFISNRLADGARNELSVIMGFPLKPGSEAQAVLGRSTFSMLTKESNAWLKNPAQEAQMIEAMKKAGELTVKSVSVRGNETIDRYSLKGLAQALEKIAKDCP